jgi:pimeloyl-ACP methyl ester carboxylesterase
MIWTVISIAVWVIVGIALLGAAAFVAGRWFFVARYPDEIHFASTEDGWRIAVTRYRAARPNGGDPVVLCPGIGTNRLALDLSDDASLAKYLAAAGHDTWIVELRGRGLSTRPRLFGRYRYDWSFDEYVEKDAPAAIDTVLRATGAERVHWVGFSLGGMVGYALLGDPKQAARIGSAVILGAPATFGFQRKYLFSWPLRNLRWVRHRSLMRLLAPIGGWLKPSLFQNKENISSETVRKMMVNATANFARNEMLQYGDWVANDRFRSIDQRRDYRKDLARATAPVLLIAGNKDRLAPPPSVKDALELIGSTEKKFVIASRGQSFEANYGHYDLVVGTRAPKEIYPLVGDWLEGKRLDNRQPAVG